jgi:hypothetical protein
LGTPLSGDTSAVDETVPEAFLAGKAVNLILPAIIKETVASGSLRSFTK